MFGPYIRTILLINDVTAAVVALISNAFLIFLVIKHTPTVLKPYSRILLQTCAIDLMFTFVIFVLRPVNFHIKKEKLFFKQFEFTDGILITIVNGFLEHVSYPWDFILNLTWCYTIVFVILTMPIPFYYRYVCMCR